MWHEDSCGAEEKPRSPVLWCAPAKFASAALAPCPAPRANRCPRSETLWRGWAPLFKTRPPERSHFPQNLPFFLSLSLSLSLSLYSFLLFFPPLFISCLSVKKRPHSAKPWASRRGAPFSCPAFACFRRSIWTRSSRATMWKSRLLRMPSITRIPAKLVSFTDRVRFSFPSICKHHWRRKPPCVLVFYGHWRNDIGEFCLPCKKTKTNSGAIKTFWTDSAPVVFNTPEYHRLLDKPFFLRNHCIEFDISCRGWNS